MSAPNRVPTFEEYQAFVAAQQAGLPNAQPTGAEVAVKPSMADVLKALVNSARFASENTVRLYHDVIDEWHAQQHGDTTDKNADGVPDKYEAPVPTPATVPAVDAPVVTSEAVPNE